MKAVYHHLSSTSRGRSNGALHLLYCIASRGPALSRELLSSFDWTLRCALIDAAAFERLCE